MSDRRKKARRKESSGRPRREGGKAERRTGARKGVIPPSGTLQHQPAGLKKAKAVPPAGAEKRGKQVKADGAALLKTGDTLRRVSPPEEKLAKRLMRADVRRIDELQKQHAAHGHAEERLRRAEARRIREGRKTRARGVLSSESLRDADRKYRTLLEQIPVITYAALLDEIATPIYTSPQIETVLGFTPAECKADPHLWIDRLHADDRDRVLAELAQALKLSKPFVSEYRTVARDGRVMWLHDSGIIVRDDQGNPPYLHGVMLDITERKAVEEALRVAEVKYRNLVENLPDVTYTAALDSTRTLYVSPQVASLLGYAPEEFLKDPGLWCKLVHSEDSQRVASEIRKAREFGEPLSLEYRFRTRDGRVIWVRDEAAVVKDAAGRPGMLQGVMVDITQRKVAEEGLLKAEAKYRSLVESLPGVTYVETLGGDPHVTYVSPQVHPILGYTQEEFLAHPAVWAGIIHPDDSSRIDAEMREFREKKRRHSTLEYRALRKDGRVIWIQDENVVVSDASGESYFLQGVLTDITAHKQAEAQMAYQAYLLSSARDPVTATDENFVLTFWNPAAEALYGMRAEEVVGRPIAEVLPTEYPGATQEEMRRELSRTGKYLEEVTRRLRDGRTLFIDLAVMALRNDLGRITGYVAVSRDITERKRAEAQIAYQANLLARVKDPVFAMDRDWRLTFWNAATEEAYGWTAEEALGQFLRDLLKVEYADTSMTADRLNQTLRETGTYRGEVIRHCKDGSVRHVDLTINVLRDETGEITGYISADRDITERKLAQEALQRSEEKYRLLIEGQTHLVIKVDTEGKFQFVSPPYCEMFGKTKEELLGHHFMPLVHEDDRELTARAMESLYKPPYTCYVEQRAMTKHGWRWMAWSDKAVLDENGKVTAIIGVGRDVTERKLAEEALRRSEARYRTLVESQVELVCRWLLDSTLTFVNEAYCKFHGKTREELLGMKWPILPPGTTGPEAEWRSEAVLKEKRLVTYEREIADCEGRKRWHQWIDSPIFDEKGNLVEIQSVGRDITDRVRAESLLRKREEVLEAISYTAEQFLKAADWEDCIDSVLARLGSVSRSDGVCLLGVRLGADGSYAATLMREWCAPNVKPLSGAPELALFDFRAYRLEEQEQALLAGQYVCAQVRNMPPAAQKLLGKYNVKSLALLPVFVDRKLWGIFAFNQRTREHKWSAAEFGSVCAAASALGTAIQKQQAQALVRIKESAIASSINGIAMFDPASRDGELTYANSAFLKMWGCESEGEILAKPFAEFLQNSEKAAQVWRSLRETGAWIGELEARREGGTVFDVQLAATRVTDAEGRPLTMIGSFIDISERAVAERKLSALLRLQQSTLATIPSSLLILDADLNVIMANSRYLESQGMQPGDAVNKNITDIFPLALLSEQSLLERIQAVAVSAGRDELTGVRYAAENHRDQFLDIHICGIKSVHGEGERPRVLLVMDDVTQQRALEEQVRQAVKMESVGKLAGGMAHDFNNLLTGISGFTDLVLEEMAADSPLRADLVQVRQLSDRAASLTRGLLAFSRRQTLQPVVLNINALLDNTSQMLKRLIGEDVDLSFVPAPDLGSVKADPGQIEQVLVNLAVNARDAMPKGGRMIVETANVALDEDYTQTHPEVKPGKYVMLSVADTGSGMDRETLSHLFEPFFTTKAPGKGTGLGLATAYGIIKQHEGSMSVYSEPGRGTTFRIYLPRVAAPADELAPAYPTREAEPQGAGTILVVEDEAAVRAFVKRVLEKQGYTVLTVAEVDEAERIVDERGKEIRLLLTDVVMPGRSGPELYQRLSAKQPSLRVLFMSGYTNRSMSQNGILRAAMWFISKPFSGEQLARKVRQVLA